MPFKLLFIINFAVNIAGVLIRARQYNIIIIIIPRHEYARLYRFQTNKQNIIDLKHMIPVTHYNIMLTSPLQTRIFLFSTSIIIVCVSYYINIKYNARPNSKLTPRNASRIGIIIRMPFRRSKSSYFNNNNNNIFHLYCVQ